jgi:hypothetical protein
MRQVRGFALLRSLAVFRSGRLHAQLLRLPRRREAIRHKESEKPASYVCNDNDEICIVRRVIGQGGLKQYGSS